MQRISTFAKEHLLDFASSQIPEVAKNTDPVFLYCQHDHVNQLVAGAIHDFSTRNDKPFLTVECRTVEIHLPGSPNLHTVKRDLNEVLRMVESGMGEWLMGGTVLLNHLAELTAPRQKELIDRLTRSLNCRILANMHNGRNRVATIEHTLPVEPATVLVVPPLRNHIKNIQFFVNYFLAKVNMEWGRNITGITSATMKRCMDYAWPGDLNELREVICQAAMLAKDGEELHESFLPLYLKEYNNDASSLRKAILTAEHKMIQQALQEASYNKKKAAAILNISRKTLYSKLRMYQEFAA
ncbi:MAG: helix-turn-helix domain-containing protein [Chitinophagaceae bacterium]